MLLINHTKISTSLGDKHFSLSNGLAAPTLSKVKPEIKLAFCYDPMVNVGLCEHVKIHYAI